MSDIQDPLIILQRRKQQRQILAMMGIDQWVRPDTATLTISDIATADIASAAIDSTVNDHQAHSSNQGDSHTSSQHPSHKHASRALPDTLSNTPESVTEPYEFESHTVVHPDETADSDGYPARGPTSTSPVSYNFDSLSNHGANDAPDKRQQASKAIKQAVAPLVDTVTATPSAQPPKHDLDMDAKKVAPFDLQGGRYGNWVILVDIQALDQASQKLWHNITQALSIACETTSFPICAGMDTAELANASFAGYVFKISRSEDSQVAALTALPEGLEHPKLTAVPTLDEMIADGHLKRQLWEQISS